MYKKFTILITIAALSTAINAIDDIDINTLTKEQALQIYNEEYDKTRYKSLRNNAWSFLMSMGAITLISSALSNDLIAVAAPTTVLIIGCCVFQKKAKNEEGDFIKYANRYKKVEKHLLENNWIPKENINKYIDKRMKKIHLIE